MTQEAQPLEAAETPQADIPTTSFAAESANLTAEHSRPPHPATFNRGMWFALFAGMIVLGSIALTWAWVAKHPTSAKAQYEVGLKYEGDGVNANPARAAYWIQKAADQGYEAAQVRLGDIYLKGSGVKQDYGRAFYWYGKAAERGDAGSEVELGFMYEAGLGVHKDDDKAFYWYRKASEQGDALAEANLGVMYSGGEGIQKNGSQALYWYRMAAQQGNATGELNLGVDYFLGTDGLKKDDAQAVYWYKKSAEQGEGRAESYLGYMYLNGWGVQPDIQKANSLFRKAAEQGDATGEYLLGNDYSKGLGIPQNTELAIYWCQRAVAQGDEDAKEPLQEILAEQKVEQEKREALMGTPITFEQFVAQVKTNGVIVGKRFSFLANPEDGTELGELCAPGGTSCIAAVGDFDDQSEYRQLIATLIRKVDSTCHVVVSLGYRGVVHIHRANECE